jgi:hypothetical protein
LHCLCTTCCLQDVAPSPSHSYRRRARPKQVAHAPSHAAQVSAPQLTSFATQHLALFVIAATCTYRPTNFVTAQAQCKKSLCVHCIAPLTVSPVCRTVTALSKLKQTCVTDTTQLNNWCDGTTTNQGSSCSSQYTVTDPCTGKYIVQPSTDRTSSYSHWVYVPKCTASGSSQYVLHVPSFTRCTHANCLESACIYVHHTYYTHVRVLTYLRRAVVFVNPTCL